MLLEQINNLNEKIEIANNKYSSESLQSEKTKQSIKIITANAKIKEHEFKVLRKGLVNAEDAERVFAQGRESFHEMSMNMIDDVSFDIANMNDPNEIQQFLEANIRLLLANFSLA